MDDWNTKRDGIKIRIAETGEEFNSIIACAKYLGVNASWLGKVTRGNERLCTCYGYHLIRVDDPRENYDLNKTEYRGRKGIKIRIVETGEEFNSISECAASINGSVGSIHDALYNNRNRNSYRGMHFEFVD